MSYLIRNNQLDLVIERYLTKKQALKLINEFLRQNYTGVNAAIKGTQRSIYSVEAE